MSSIPKPPLGSLLNLGHPLSRGLRACYLLNEGMGGILSNTGLDRNQSAYFTDKCRWDNSSVGPSVYITGADKLGLSLGKLAEWNQLYAWTIIALVKCDTALSDLPIDSFIVSDDGNSSFAREFFLRLSPTDGGSILTRCTVGGINVNSRITVPTATQQENDGWFFAGSWWNGSRIGVFYNNSDLEIDPSATGSGPSVDRRTKAGNVRAFVYSSDSVNYFRGQIGAMWFWDRALSDAERADFNLDPYGMFKQDELIVSGPPPVTGIVNEMFGSGGIHNRLTSVG